VHALSDVRIFYRECCSLVKAEYEVHLVIPADKSITKQGVHVQALPTVKNRLLRMLLMPWVAMIKALRTKASLYHYHDPELLLMGFVLRWVLGKKVVFDIHESVFRQIMSKPYLPRSSRKMISLCYRLLERIFIAGQSLIIANKNSVSDYPSNTYLVQNYPLMIEEMSAVAAAEKRKSSIPLLVYVGGVTKIRGAMVYIELAGKLAEHGHDFHMKLVGPYTEEYGRELKSKIQELDLENKVVLTGRMDWMEAMKLVAQATIGMCLLLPVPNYTTCLATKIIEYMMLGTPVLVSDFDCWRDFVAGEKVGMMADPTNIDAVVEVCEWMLNNPGELAAMGERGIEAVRSKYNWPSEFQELLRCYEDLLGKYD
jgi:glycosyltransferase involved in cell wall biosynthesis